MPNDRRVLPVTRATKLRVDVMACQAQGFGGAGERADGAAAPAAVSARLVPNPAATRLDVPA